jgi:hypothetical protein
VWGAYFQGKRKELGRFEVGFKRFQVLKCVFQNFVLSDFLRSAVSLGGSLVTVGHEDGREVGEATDGSVQPRVRRERVRSKSMQTTTHLVSGHSVLVKTAIRNVISEGAIGRCLAGLMICPFRATFEQAIAVLFRVPISGSATFLILNGGEGARVAVLDATFSTAIVFRCLSGWRE